MCQNHISKLLNTHRQTASRQTCSDFSLSNERPSNTTPRTWKSAIFIFSQNTYRRPGHPNGSYFQNLVNLPSAWQEWAFMMMSPRAWDIPGPFWIVSISQAPWHVLGRTQVERWSGRQEANLAWESGCGCLSLPTPARLHGGGCESPL